MEGLTTIKRKLLAVDCLKAMKEEKTFRALSEELELPIGVINRYVNGYVLPREKRSMRIIDHFFNKHFDRMIRSLSSIPDSKYRVTISILTNNFLLSLIAHRVHETFDIRVDKVLTAASDGIALGVKIADDYSCRAVYAKSSHEITQSDVIASRTVASKPRSMPLYIPENLLSRRDHVLIVDDVIRSGSTIEALHDLCKQARCRVVGVFGIFVTEGAKKQLEEQLQCPVHGIRVLKE